MRAFFLFTCAFISLAVHAQSIDSLETILVQAKGDQRISTLIILSKTIGNRDWSRTLSLAIEAKEIAEKRESFIKKFELYQCLSFAYHGNGNYQEALKYGLQASEYAESTKESSLIFYQLGNINEQLFQLDKSLDYHLKSLEIREREGDELDIIASYRALGFIYQAMQQYEKAFEIFQKNYEKNAELGNDVGMRRATFNMGFITMEMNKHAEAIPIFRESVSGLEEEDEPHLFSRYYNNLANCFEKQLHVNAAFYDSALYYGHKNLALKTELGNVRGIANAHNGLAATYERASEYERSGYHAHEALRLSDSLDFKPIKKNALAYLITSELERGEVAHTNDHFEEYIRVFAELSDLAASKTLTEMATKFETAKTLAENGLLKNQRDQQTQINILLAVLTILLFVLVLVMAYFYRNRQAVNLRLEKDKSLISLQAQELQKLNDQKSRFFANISHGLRTPLTLIQGHADELRKISKLPAAAENPLRRIKHSISHLSVMVNDLLDLSKIDLETKQLAPKPVALDDLIRRILAAFISLAESKRVILSYASETGDTAVALVDEDHFEKVVNHLVFNAFDQLAGPGAITVSLSRVLEGLSVKFSNDGPQIHTNDIEHVFDRFYQSSQLESGGSGSIIGLSVSKELIEMMGGKLTVNSSVSATVYEIIVPPSDEEPSTKSELTTFASPTKLDQDDLLNIPSDTTVLIVEDNPDLRDYLASVLRNHFTLLTANNGQEAVEVLEKELPDLILTDVMMPVMNGWEFIEILRNRPAWAQLPVIVLTAVAENQDRLKGLRMGVDDYILKPFETEELLIRISNLVNNLRERIKWAKEFEVENDQKGQLTEQHDLVLAIKNYVLEHVSDKSMNVLQVAMHLGLSERQLYRKTAEAVGLSPSKLIQEIKLQHARELLISRKYDKLTQIAGEVGFDSTSHFSKLYLERFGKKPTDYFS
jgi:signal transduction histidine kinase/DNA-binding response OmpR family regulator